MAAERGVFTLGHAPDPDDAFMFYAMAENKIDLRGYRFEHLLEDIQTLNERALRGELHISAISIHAYAYVSSRYALLPCGASMGDGYGPVVIRKRATSNSPSRAAVTHGAAGTQLSTLNDSMNESGISALKR
jgi:1,4-dihydroxy-6-naphthoate synthase